MNETMGQRLLRLRKARGLSQREAADRLGIDRSTISAYERNMRQPSYEILVRMVSVYKVSSDYLLGIEESRSINTKGLSDKEYEAFSFLINDLSAKNKK
jgi:transcriptional regulator with XRE-family HTH domain